MPSTASTLPLKDETSADWSQAHVAALSDDELLWIVLTRAPDGRWAQQVSWAEAEYERRHPRPVRVPAVRPAPLMQPLSDRYDDQRTIIVMHRERAPGKPWSDKPYPVTELAADITPLALAKLIAADELECNRDDITAIFQIEDDGRTISNITKAIFAGAFAIEDAEYRADEVIDAKRRMRDDDLIQVGFDLERDRRAHGWPYGYGRRQDAGTLG
jgi:hypothetical protein